MNRLKVPEKSVQAEIKTMLELNGWRVHVIDVIHAEVDYGVKGKRHLRQGEVGQPDLIAVRAQYPTLGVWSVMYVECKAASGRLSRMQRVYHEVLRKDGFPVYVARSWEELVHLAGKTIYGWKGRRT